jgi:monomeric sarcosine oxidase
MRVAVVGAGIHGASVARVLAKRGHEVTVYEQFGLCHSLGSSHGESRIVRKAYPDSYYTELMAEAYPLWADLEGQSGQKLLHEVGLLYFGLEGSSNLNFMVEGLKSVQVVHSLLTAESVRDVAPQLHLDRNEVGVFTPEAGWVDARAALASTISLASQHGASFLANQPVDREVLEKKFDAYVVAPGPWVDEWCEEIDTVPTLQTVAYFEGKVTGPVWIEDSPDLAYGFPTVAPYGAKVALHRAGPECDPRSNDREADLLDVQSLEDVLSRRFGLRRPRLKSAYGCIYTTTEDEDFRFLRLGEKGFLVSACSGHGFKFGPWIGMKFADFVEGKDNPERFERFGLKGDR